MDFLIKAALFIPAFFAMTAFCVCLQRSRARREGEWNYLTPGPYYWFGMFSGILVSGVATLVVAAGKNVGVAGVMLAVFFVFVTMFLAVHGIFQQTRWNQHKIVVTNMFRQTNEMSWYELARLGMDWSGQLWISSFDGPRLTFSPYDNGYDQLFEKIRRHLPEDGPPPEPLIEFPEMLQRAEAVAPARSSRRKL